MAGESFHVGWDADGGLRLRWAAGRGVELKDVPLRVRVRGANVFRVWTLVDSGEGPPGWAEPEMALTLFGGAEASPGVEPRVERFEGPDGAAGWRVVAAHERAEAMLELRRAGEELEAALTITNPQGLGGRSLPLSAVDLCIDDLTVGPGAVYQNAHAYGGRTHGVGELAALEADGVPFIHGCIGLALPLVYLHQPRQRKGLQIEFMMDGRPTAWLSRGRSSKHANWRMTWALDRLLAPGQVHAFGGRLRLRAYEGRPVEMMRRWRDAAETRYGLKAVPTPDWARRANIIEFNTHPTGHHHPFQRLDDPRVRELLTSWKEMGYDTLFTVGHNHTGTHFLSPYDYEPCAAAGGFEAEKQYLDWAHELGFRAFLWVTTVGMERRAPEVRARPDWWTHRPDGSLFYAWDSHRPEYVGYAPDGDPLSTGWRAWLTGEVSKLIARGFDGIFIDGCIPRASNHARWDWPGQGRNGVADQVVELAEHLRALGPDLATLVEDDGLYAQCCCEVTQGRYFPVPPYFKKAHWDHGMGGGPEAGVAAPKRICPETAREYLLVRYASRLPGVVTKEGHEGYYSDQTRPWGVQMLLAGMVPKTHSQYVDEPETWRPIRAADEPPESEKAPAHRREGHAEFVRLLKLARDEPLLREAPLSIEGVAVAGDEAVVGILRASADRAILGLIQFAGRAAAVHVRLADPVDVPAVERDAAGRPDRRTWRAREILRSMVDAEPAGEATLSGAAAMEISLGPYGFRVFELTPSR